jgi:DNA helicase II / ATP-dependent DNA helicase PcrA
MSLPHTSPEYTRAYATLNAAQQKAVDTIEGPVMVMAGPGTGKTQVLTLRIAHILLTTDTPPDAVLALTFTNSGVRAMRERLYSLIGDKAYRVGIYTFHGYASTIIDNFGERFPRIIGARSADDVDRIHIIRDILVQKDMSPLRPTGDPEYYIQKLLTLIGTLKADRVRPDEYRTYVERALASLGESEPSTTHTRSRRAADVYQRYEDELRKRGLYDYHDMLLELIATLEADEEFRFELAESAQYILADEHQDANASQNRILELLADVQPDNAPNLFIVGDDKQAIYRFQGASLENFLYFTARYPNAMVIPLTHNYRSKARILNAAYTLMDGYAHTHSPLHTTSDGGDVSYTLVAREEDEVDFVAHEVKKCIESGVLPDEIAILFRKNKDMDPFIRALEGMNIATASYRDTDILESPEVLMLFSLIRACVDPYNDAVLSKALFLPGFQIPTSDLAQCLREKGAPLIERMERYRSMDTARNSFLHAFADSRTKPVLTLFDEIVIHASFTTQLLRAEHLDTALRIYKNIRTLIEERVLRTPGMTLSDTVPLIDDIESGAVSFAVSAVRGEGVQLMSLHKAKGLEFEHVFLPHVLESRFKARKNAMLFLIPPGVNVPEPQSEDERRLLYVGITRAKSQVQLTAHRERSDGKEEPPSRLLDSMPELSRTIDTHHAELAHPHPRDASQLRHEYTALIKAFLESGISATALNTYVRDPWECFIEHVLRMPHTQSPHQVYGNGIHRALEIYATHLREGKNVDINLLHKACMQTLRSVPMPEEDYRVLRDRGREVLKAYIELYGDTFPKNTKTELHMKATLPRDEGMGIPVHGFIDRVDILANNHVRVTDYKTGKPKSRNQIEGKTKDSDGAYKRQMVFYKLLLDLDRTYTLEDCTINFVEANERGIHKQESFTITDDEVATLTKEIYTMVDDLTAGGFITKTSLSEDREVRALSEVLRLRFA